MNYEELDKDVKQIWNRHFNGEISYGQVQIELDQLFGNPKNLGVIQQIKTYLQDSVPISEKRWLSMNCLDYLEQKMDELFLRANWEVIFTMNEPIPINDTIKADINKTFERLIEDETTSQGKLIKGYNAWIHWLLNIDRILSYFLYKTGFNENTKLFKIFEEYYDFLRTECENREFEIPEPFNTNPIDRYYNNRGEKETRRPNCPECGSDKIVSNGVNWLCNSCGRQFRKNPRR